MTTKTMSIIPTDLTKEQYEDLPASEKVAVLEAALADLMDGARSYDIQTATGLSAERCKEIYDLAGVVCAKVFG
jgi:hypothetical protein